MSFGGGSQSSQAKSSGFDVANALGINWNNQTNQNISENFSKGGSFIAGQQLPFLEMLWGEASKAYQSLPGNIGSEAQRINKPLMGGAMSAFDTLGGLTNTDALISSQETGLRSGLQNLFSMGKQGIAGDATRMGAFGGDRHALQEAALGGEVARAYTEGYGDIVNNARTQSMNAANSRIGAAPSIYNLGMSPFMAGFQPLQAFANLLGGPTVLSQQQSGGYGAGFGYGSAGGIDTSSSYGQRTSKSSGEGWDFNMGFK